MGQFVVTTQSFKALSYLSRQVLIVIFTLLIAFSTTLSDNTVGCLDGLQKYGRNATIPVFSVYDIILQSKLRTSCWFLTFELQKDIVWTVPQQTQWEIRLMQTVEIKGRGKKIQLPPNLLSNIRNEGTLVISDAILLLDRYDKGCSLCTSHSQNNLLGLQFQSFSSDSKPEVQILHSLFVIRNQVDASPDSQTPPLGRKLLNVSQIKDYGSAGWRSSARRLSLGEVAYGEYSRVESRSRPLLNSRQLNQFFKPRLPPLNHFLYPKNTRLGRSHSSARRSLKYNSDAILTKERIFELAPNAQEFRGNLPDYPQHDLNITDSFLAVAGDTNTHLDIQNDTFTVTTALEMVEILWQHGREEVDDELIIELDAAKFSIQPDSRFPIEALRPIVLKSAPGQRTHLEIAEGIDSWLFSSHSYVDKRDMFISGPLVQMAEIARARVQEDENPDDRLVIPHCSSAHYLVTFLDYRGDLSRFSDLLNKQLVDPNVVEDPEPGRICNPFYAASASQSQQLGDYVPEEFICTNICGFQLALQNSNIPQEMQSQSTQLSDQQMSPGLRVGLLAGFVAIIGVSIFAIIAAYTLRSFNRRTHQLTAPYHSKESSQEATGSCDPPTETTGSLKQSFDQATNVLGTAFRPIAEGPYHCSWQDIRLPIDEEHSEVKIHGMIASGGFGAVYRGTWMGRAVAVKMQVFTEDAVSSRGSQHSIFEAAVTYSIRHPHIVQTYKIDVYQNTISELPQELQQIPYVRNLVEKQSLQLDSQICVIQLVQDYCDGGSLQNQILARGWPHENLVDMGLVLNLAMQSAEGVCTLHRHDVIHGDLNPNNILLSSPECAKKGGSGEYKYDKMLSFLGTGVPIVKVADLGLSVQLESSNIVSGFRSGTPFYIAPEVFMFGLLTKAADVYSMGILMWEMYHARPVYYRRQPEVKYAPHPLFPSFPLTCPLPYALLAGLCLSPCAEQRPTMPQLLDMLKRMAQVYLAGSCRPGTHNVELNREFAPQISALPALQVMVLVRCMLQMNSLYQTPEALAQSVYQPEHEMVKTRHEVLQALNQSKADEEKAGKVQRAKVCSCSAIDVSKVHFEGAEIKRMLRSCVLGAGGEPVTLATTLAPLYASNVIGALSIRNTQGAEQPFFSEVAQVRAYGINRRSQMQQTCPDPLSDRQMSSQSLPDFVWSSSETSQGKNTNNMVLQEGDVIDVSQGLPPSKVQTLLPPVASGLCGATPGTQDQSAQAYQGNLTLVRQVVGTAGFGAGSAPMQLPPPLLDSTMGAENPNLASQPLEPLPSGLGVPQQSVIAEQQQQMQQQNLEQLQQPQFRGGFSQGVKGGDQPSGGVYASPGYSGNSQEGGYPGVGEGTKLSDFLVTPSEKLHQQGLGNVEFDQTQLQQQWYDQQQLRLEQIPESSHVERQLFIRHMSERHWQPQRQQLVRRAISQKGKEVVPQGSEPVKQVQMQQQQFLGEILSQQQIRRLCADVKGESSLRISSSTVAQPPAVQLQAPVVNQPLHRQPLGTQQDTGLTSNFKLPVQQHVHSPQQAWPDCESKHLHMALGAYYTPTAATQGLHQPPLQHMQHVPLGQGDTNLHAQGPPLQPRFSQIPPVRIPPLTKAKPEQESLASLPPLFRGMQQGGEGTTHVKLADAHQAAGYGALPIPPPGPLAIPESLLQGLHRMQPGLRPNQPGGQQSRDQGGQSSLKPALQPTLAGQQREEQQQQQQRDPNPGLVFGTPYRTATQQNGMLGSQPGGGALGGEKLNDFNVQLSPRAGSNEGSGRQGDCTCSSGLSPERVAPQASLKDRVEEQIKQQVENLQRSFNFHYRNRALQREANISRGQIPPITWLQNSQMLHVQGELQGMVDNGAQGREHNAQQQKPQHWNLQQHQQLQQQQQARQKQQQQHSWNG